MFCIRCGIKLPDDALFCLGCGTKIHSESVVVNSGIASAGEKGEEKIFKLGGNTIVFDKDITELNRIITPIRKFAVYAEKRAGNFVFGPNSVSIDDYLQKGLPLFTDLVNESLREGVKVLMNEGIDDVDLKMLGEYCGEKIDLSQKKGIKRLLKLADEIEAAALGISEKRLAERGTRSYWSGGGFGLQGAIKGAATAGAMNMGLGAIRAIGDSFVDSKDANRLRVMKEAAVSDSGLKYAIVSSVTSGCASVWRGVAEVLFERGIIKEIDFDTSELRRKAKNYGEFGKKESEEQELIKILRKDPYHPVSYTILYRIFKYDYKELYEIASYWNMERWAIGVDRLSEEDFYLKYSKQNLDSNLFREGNGSWWYPFLRGEQFKTARGVLTESSRDDVYIKYGVPVIQREINENNYSNELIYRYNMKKYGENETAQAIKNAVLCDEYFYENAKCSGRISFYYDNKDDVIMIGYVTNAK